MTIVTLINDTTNILKKLLGQHLRNKMFADKQTFPNNGAESALHLGAFQIRIRFKERNKEH